MKYQGSYNQNTGGEEHNTLSALSPGQPSSNLTISQQWSPGCHTGGEANIFKHNVVDCPLGDLFKARNRSTKIIAGQVTIVVDLLLDLVDHPGAHAHLPPLSSVTARTTRGRSGNAWPVRECPSLLGCSLPVHQCPLGNAGGEGIHHGFYRNSIFSHGEGREQQLWRSCFRLL